VSGPVALLDAIVRDALDPSYAEAAARPQAAPKAGRNGRRRRTATGVALLAAVGALSGLAVFAQHKSVPEVGAARSALAGDAGERTREVKQLEQSLAADERQIAALTQQRLQSTSAGRALAAQAGLLSTALARTPTAGQGVTVTVTDVLSSTAPDAGSRPQGELAGRTGQVTDRDLQTVVNALWAAGARAIGVGGVRLGPQTAIRTAGQTILVEFKSLSSPYVVTAIGGAGLASAAQRSRPLAALGAGPAGTHPGVAIQASSALTLPAASAGATGSARPLTGGHS
jgi:uncharacterized protein YlxW (UPF0749 family)